MGEQTIRICGWSLRGLARKFPAKVPRKVQESFDLTLEALGLDGAKHHLVYIPTRAIRFAEKNIRGEKGVFDFMREYTKTVAESVKVIIGSMGQCSGRTAFVVQSARGGRPTERSVAIHEALHFVFGPHPWPNKTASGVKTRKGD